METFYITFSKTQSARLIHNWRLYGSHLEIRTIDRDEAWIAAMYAFGEDGFFDIYTENSNLGTALGEMDIQGKINWFVSGIHQHNAQGETLCSVCGRASF